MPRRISAPSRFASSRNEITRAAEDSVKSGPRFAPEPAFSGASLLFIEAVVLPAWKAFMYVISIGMRVSEAPRWISTRSVEMHACPLWKSLLETIARAAFGRSASSRTCNRKQVKISRSLRDNKQSNVPPRVSYHPAQTRRVSYTSLLRRR